MPTDPTSVLVHTQEDKPIVFYRYVETIKTVVTLISAAALANGVRTFYVINENSTSELPIRDLESIGIFIFFVSLVIRFLIGNFAVFDELKTTAHDKKVPLGFPFHDLWMTSAIVLEAVIICFMSHYIGSLLKFCILLGGLLAFDLLWYFGTYIIRFIILKNRKFFGIHNIIISIITIAILIVIYNLNYFKSGEQNKIAWIYALLITNLFSDLYFNAPEYFGYEKSDIAIRK